MNSKTASKEILSKENLPLSSKLGFGGASFSSAVLQGIAFGSITFFYNVILGLNEGLLGIAWLIFAAWNAINDPLFGLIEDRTKSKKYGRRIPYLRFGGPIYGLLFILCWFPLVDLNNQLALFFNFLLLLFTFDTIYTIIGLITYSLPAEMTVSSNARANLMVYGALFGALGFLMSFLLPILFLTGVTGELGISFYVVMIIVGIICGTILFISSYYIKENKYTQLEEPLGIVDSFKETFKNKPFLIFEVSNFSFLLAQTILTTAVFYYLSYVLNLSGFMAMVPMILFFLMVFVFTVVYSKILKKLGVKKTFIVVLVFVGFSFILFFFIGWVFETAIIGMLLLGAGFSGYFVTGQMVMADVIDHDEILTKKRRETTYSGMNALITKPAISIANWLFLSIIATFGFQKESLTQEPLTQLGIMIGFTLIPAIFILFSAFAMKYFPLDGEEWNKKKEELKKIHAEKEKRYIEQLEEQGIL
ncbi:MAG: MFS transporter [Promethearchaeota archaeon]